MQEIKQEYRYSVAPKGKRFLAFLIDLSILVVLVIAFRQLIINVAANALGLDLTVTEIADRLKLENFYLAIDCIMGLPIVIIVYLVPPLIFKNGQTVGKKCLGLILITKNGQAPRLNSLLFRAIIGIWIVEYVGSLFLYFAPFVLSVVLTLINKKAPALHDYLAGTIVVSKDPILVDVKVEPPLVEDTQPEMTKE
jgi:uncharacterized RDD family membrane protein YckC